MLGLPKSTEFNRKIPKQKFYENLSVTPELKRVFIEQIKGIIWQNKIAPSTMNLAPGVNVNEIEIFEVKLTKPHLDSSVLIQIDRQIPYHIVFLLEYEGKYQAWTAFKEAAVSGANAFRVGTYYHTEWFPESELPLRAEGLHMDAVYENFVRQIGGVLLQTEGDESLKDSVERDNRKKALRKQIEMLQSKVRKETQLNKQVLLNTELKKLRNELKELENG